jgi:hypothetical protein
MLASGCRFWGLRWVERDPFSPLVKWVESEYEVICKGRGLGIVLVGAAVDEDFTRG